MTESDSEIFHMMLRPMTWLIHLPLAALPFLAACVLQVRFLSPHALYWRDLLFIPAQHWFWIGVASGLGIWVGWRTALPTPEPAAEQVLEQP